MNICHKDFALKMIEDYPVHTKGIDIEEIIYAWEQYSDLYAAGWLLENDESVKMVMDNIRKKKDDELKCKQDIASSILQTWVRIKDNATCSPTQEAFKCVDDIYNMVKDNINNKSIIPWRCD